MNVLYWTVGYPFFVLALRALELNYHKNSQRYKEFNFDPKNNYFRLKSEIFIKMGPKLEILAIYPI